MIKRTKSILKSIIKGHQLIDIEFPVEMKPRYADSDSLNFDHSKTHSRLYEIVNANRPTYLNFLHDILSYSENLHAITQTQDATAPHWNNGFLPGLDIIGIYAIIAKYKPSKYLEVGSGNSTKVAFKAKSEKSPGTEIISVDPYPRAEIDAISDRVIRKRFEDIEEDLISDLQSGDVLFIDNSHVILPNSDAMVFFMETLPQVKPGVIIHIHDIYLPYDYPQYMCDRAYNEQYGLAFYLLAAPEKFDILMPNFFVSKDKELSSILQPFWNHPNLNNVEKHGGSFWFRKK